MENNIKLLRIRAGLTQAQLSKKIGIPQNELSRYENAESLDKKYIGTVCRIADGLGVTINEVISPLKISYAQTVVDLVAEKAVRAAELSEKSESEGLTDEDIQEVIENRWM